MGPRGWRHAIGVSAVAALIPSLSLADGGQWTIDTMPSSVVDNPISIRQLPNAQMADQLMGEILPIWARRSRNHVRELRLAGSPGRGTNNAASSTECEENVQGRLYQNLPAPYDPTMSTEIVHTRIGGRDFYVPRNYFRHPQIGCGVEEAAMLLRVLLPDLEPYSEETAPVFKAQRGHGRSLAILVSRGSDIKSPSELAKIHAKGSTIKKASEASFGLSRAKHRHGDDVFLNYVGSQVSALIRCNQFLPDRGASCKHHFRRYEHHVRIRYGREHLSEWNSIQASVEALLDSFVYKPDDEADRMKSQ